MEIVEDRQADDSKCPWQIKNEYFLRFPNFFGARSPGADKAGKKSTAQWTGARSRVLCQCRQVEKNSFVKRADAPGSKKFIPESDRDDGISVTLVTKKRAGIAVLIATWNLNHRVGKTRFRAEAVNAVAALQADVVVLTEYYPRDYESVFRADLSNAGWHLLASEIVGEIANRVLMTSRFPLEPFPLPLPDFDRQFPPNILCVTIPAAGIRVLGIRIPAYIGEDRHYISRSWDWLESTLSGLHDAPTIVAGDFNVNVDSPRAKGGDHFRRILANGWRRSAPKGQGSYFGPNGRRAEIDHILCNSGLSFADARYVTEAGGFQLAGTTGALSDHAAVLAWVQRK